MDWKKNFRKVPQKIHNKLATINEQEIIVGCLSSFSREEVLNGSLSHLQISLSDEGLIFPEEIIPLPSQGKHSFWNINGREIVRKDLPKETYYNYVEAPSWGSHYQTHTVALPGERYPRDFIAPRNSTIEIECANVAPELSLYAIKFQISEVVNRESKNFEERLFDCLNLLQENIGDCGVERAGVTLQDYIKTLQVAWDIFPPGTVEEVIARVFAGREPTQEEQDTTQERHDFFMTLNPQSLVYGKSGFQRYFGALINENLVVFENVKYGNAIYVMFNDWKDLCQKSRIDLLSGKYGDNFERVLHLENWQNKVRRIVEEAL